MITGTRPVDELPLVYACSGCSSAAQLANHLAVRLDRAGAAEMSCIAGVGGGVKALVRTAQRGAASGRHILAIEGCPLACVRACLARAGVVAGTELRLHEHGVRKVQHGDFDPVQAEALLAHCRGLLTPPTAGPA
ncbi:MAG: putative zinc-binding protein [Roseateles sp.]|uniref:putative zinc-binding protein n=1 Tax=Roseateles sp. TaxID=1971397 RepID=UPI004036AC3A